MKQEIVSREQIMKRAKGRKVITGGIRIIETRSLGMAGFRRARDAIKFAEEALLLHPRPAFPFHAVAKAVDIGSV